MVVIVAQLSYIEHGSQEVLMAATAFVRARIDETLKDEAAAVLAELGLTVRSEEHTSELQSLMRISYAVFCLKKKNNNNKYKNKKQQSIQNNKHNTAYTP